MSRYVIEIKLIEIEVPPPGIAIMGFPKNKTLATQAIKIEDTEGVAKTAFAAGVAEVIKEVGVGE